MDTGLTRDFVGDAGETRPLLQGDGYLSICVAAMDAVAAPVYVVYSDGCLVLANFAAKSCLFHGRWLRSQGGRVVSSRDYRSTPALASALLQLRRGNGSTVLLTHQPSGRQAVLTLSPIAAAIHPAVGDERLGLIWLTTSDPEATPMGHVALVFNLTRAERELLAELASGACVREAATRLNVSIHTARNQLKSVLNKTGRRSQAQLLSLVTRMGSLRLPEQD